MDRPDDEFGAWLDRLHLRALWQRAGDLPEPRMDFYRGACLKLYVAARRKFERDAERARRKALRRRAR